MHIELGYSQGMAFLAAMLMLHIEDEEVFTLSSILTFSMRFTAIGLLMVRRRLLDGILVFGSHYVFSRVQCSCSL
jgi:hypothetical protein